MPREGPARARGHRLHREVRAALEAAQAAGHSAPGPQREVPRARGRDHRPGGAREGGDHRHQHGGAGHRYPARRQSRLPRQGAPVQERARSRDGARRSARAGLATGEEDHRPGARPRGRTGRAAHHRHRAPRVAPDRQSAPRAAPGARATPAPRASICRSRTTSCGSSAPSASSASWIAWGWRRASRSSTSSSPARSAPRRSGWRRGTSRSASTCSSTTT